MAEIPDADFYDCCNREDGLSLQSPEEALEELLDGHAVKGESIVDCIRRLAPIELVCWRHRVVPPSFWKSIAWHPVETAMEDWEEEFGGPDYPEIDEADMEAAREAVAAALQKAWGSIRPWQCEEIARVEVPAEQVEALMREHRPEWFEADQEQDRKEGP